MPRTPSSRPPSDEPTYADTCPTVRTVHQVRAVFTGYWGRRRTPRSDPTRWFKWPERVIPTPKSGIASRPRSPEHHAKLTSPTLGVPETTSGPSRSGDGHRSVDTAQGCTKVICGSLGRHAVWLADRTGGSRICSLRRRRDGLGDGPRRTVLVRSRRRSLLLLLMRALGNELQHAQTSAFIAYALVLGAAVFVYFHWRMTSHAGSGHRGEAGRLADGRPRWSPASRGSVAGRRALDTVAAAADSWPQVGQLVPAGRADRRWPTSPSGSRSRATPRWSARRRPAAHGGYLVVLSLASALLVSPTSLQLLNTVVLVAGSGARADLLQRTQVSLWVAAPARGVRDPPDAGRSA